jgi:hypothetical protein
MGERHEALSSQIDSLNQAMKLSRQRGAFQELQNQMAAVKKLVKEREEIDGKMATVDLARKKTDDHNIAVGMETSYTEQLDSVNSRINRLQELLQDFSESMGEGEFDFTRCVRPDGSAYGTRGKCKKGTEGGPAPMNKGTSQASPAKESKIKEENYSWGRLIKASNDFASNKAILHPEHQAQLHKLKDGEKTSFEDEQRVKWNAERKGDHVHLTSPREGKKPIVIAHSRLGTGKDEASSPKRRKTTEELKIAAMRMHDASMEAARREVQARKERQFIDKETKGDIRREAKQRRAAAQKAHEKAQALAEKTLSAAIKSHSAWVRSNEKGEKAKMSPQQRAASREVEKTIKERG